MTALRSAMTEELFDLLRRKGLKDSESVERIILESYTLSQVMDLDRQLSEIVERGCRTPAESEPTGFDLFPNDAISAGRGGCWDFECRLDRADSLSRSNCHIRSAGLRLVRYARRAI
jgi:hypothetical protein